MAGKNEIEFDGMTSLSKSVKKAKYCNNNFGLTVYYVCINQSKLSLFA